MTITFEKKTDQLLQVELFNSQKWKAWYNKASLNYDIESILIYKVNMFGSKLGFVYMEVFGKDKAGNSFPGIVFLRGDSVSILTTITCTTTSERYIVLTEQNRIPAGKPVLESPAGMLDEGEPSSIAIEELKEEVGTDIDFSNYNLIPLSGGYTSPGGTDEYVSIFCYDILLSPSEIRDLNGRITGNQSENENITLRIMTLDQALQCSESIMTKYAILQYKAINI